MVETECAGKAICFTAGIKESGLRFIRGSFVLVLLSMLFVISSHEADILDKHVHEILLSETSVMEETRDSLYGSGFAERYVKEICSVGKLYENLEHIRDSEFLDMFRRVRENAKSEVMASAPVKETISGTFSETELLRTETDSFAAVSPSVPTLDIPDNVLPPESGNVSEEEPAPPAVLPDVPAEEVPDVPVDGMPDVPAEEVPEHPGEGGEDAGLSGIVDGFLVDESGMIYGLAPGADVVYDGYLLKFPTEGVTGIKSGAFLSAPAGIMETYIPANITVIEPGAFHGLGELEWIEVDALNPNYTSADGALFTADMSCLLKFPPARTDIYNVPGSVVRVADFAFADTHLSKIDMRMCGVIEFGASVFGEGNGAGVTVIVPEQWEDIYRDAFLCYDVTVESAF